MTTKQSLPTTKESKPKMKLPKSIRAESDLFIYDDYIDYDALTDSDHAYLATLSLKLDLEAFYEL